MSMMLQRCDRCGEEYYVGVVGTTLHGGHQCPLGEAEPVEKEMFFGCPSIDATPHQVDQIDGEIPFHSIPSGGDILRFDRAQQEDSED